MRTASIAAARTAAALLLAMCTACATRAPGARAASPASATEVAHPLLADAAPAPATEPAPQAQPAPQAEPTAQTETAHRRSGGPGRTLGWVSIAVGGEAAVLAIVTSFMMLHDKDVRDAGCNAAKVCTPDAYSANGALDSLGPWNAAAYAVAAVGLGAGVILLATSSRDRERSTSLVVAPNGSGAGLGLRGAF
jgi:hypothetical protein